MAGGQAAIPCVPSELDIFSRSRIQNAILGHQVVGLKTVNAVTQPLSTLEYFHSGASDYYRDLSHVYLRLRVCLRGEDGNPLLIDNNVGVANNLLYTLFQTMEVFLNERCVCRLDHFGYKSYIETVLNNPPEAAKTHLRSQFFYLDTPAHCTEATEANEGFTMRKNKLTNSKTVELYGRLSCGLFNQKLLLPQGLDLRLKLTFAPEALYLWSNDPANTARLHIVDSTLYLKQVLINPGVLLAHSKILASGSCHALYPMKKIEMKTFVVGPGARTLSLNSVCQGRLPSFLCFTMVENVNFNGHMQRNPFAFVHKSITNVSIFINAEEHRIGPLQFSLDNPSFTYAYHSLFTAFGNDIKKTHMITPDMYAHGTFLACKDITPDGSGNISHTSLASSGVVRIEATFADEIDVALTCLVLLEYDCVLEVDQSRNVFIS